MNDSLSSAGRFHVWVMAARPKTLWAAVAPVVVGSALAYSEERFHWWTGLAALCGALLLQIAANLANDLDDFERGTDTAERLGPLRVTQAGLVTPRQMRVAVSVAIAFSLVPGLYLIMRGGWPILAIGVAGIISALLYTGGRVAYGYRGLGEIFVFLFFGVVAVPGTYYVHALDFSRVSLWLGVPMGCMAVAILTINNMRDLDTDRKAGKRTLAVRLGRTGARIEYVTMLGVAFGTPLVLALTKQFRWGVALASAVVLVALPVIRTVFTVVSGEALNHSLAQTARLQMIYALVLSVGLNL